MVKIRSCIFISGQGSNLKNIIFRSRDNSFPIKVSLVISNNKNAMVLIMLKNIKFLLYSLINNLKNNENKNFILFKKVQYFIYLLSDI